MPQVLPIATADAYLLAHSITLRSSESFLAIRMAELGVRLTSHACGLQNTLQEGRGQHSMKVIISTVPKPCPLFSEEGVLGYKMAISCVFLGITI